MATDDNEEKLLRSVALQNANSILLARQRAERELIATKEALEQKTEELAHSLAMMRATLESTSNGILVTNANGEITGFNQNFVDLWRLPAEIMNEGQHRRVLDITSCRFSEPEKFRARIEEIYTTSPPNSFDILELADGTVIERYSKIQFVDERNVGRVWSFRDITERRRAEEELRQQREWYQITLSSIGDAVITTNVQGKVTFLNPVAESLTGWKTGEATGRPLAEIFRIINEETRQPVENPVKKVMAEGKVAGLANHTVLIAKDGTERPIDDSAAPIRGAEGKVLGAVLVFRDISERRNIDRRVQESEERFRSLVGIITDVPWTTDAEGRFVTPQPAWAAYTGQSWDELRDFGWANALHPEDRENIRAIWQRACETKSLYKSEGRLWHASNQQYRYFEARATPLIRPDGSVHEWVGTCTDMHERKLAEEKLRESEEQVRLLNVDLENRVSERTVDLWRAIGEHERLQDQLLQAQKLKSVGTLASGVAHDFNNILNIIQGYASILREEGLDHKEVRQSLAVINETIQRGSALVQQLLTMARKSDATFEPVNVNVVIEGLITLIRDTFPKTIDVGSALEPDLPLLRADANQISQALLNLCLNARDAMPNGGKLIIKTTGVDGAVMRHLDAGAVGRYVCIEISDTGIGMDESVRTRIFEPFFTTKEVGQGTGLGLAVVYGTVKNHNGFIDVQSKPMQGTTFRLYLPAGSGIERPAPDLIPELISETTAGSTASTTILLVEDEKNMLNLLEKILSPQGYQLLTASDGETALDLYQRHKERIDIVLLDMGIPKLSGQDVLVNIKREKPGVKVVVASGYLEPELKSQINLAGVKHFLNKPYSLDEVVKTLQSLSEKE